MNADSISVRVDRRIAAAPERVFDAWLMPGKVRLWMGAALSGFGLPGEMQRVEIDARVGGRFTFSDLRKEGEAIHWGTYLVIDRPRKLVFTWFTSAEDEQEARSTVTLEIEADGAGSRVVLVHEMAAKWVEYAKRTEDGWGRMLAQIDTLSSEPPGATVAADTVRIERLLPGPIERLWSYLTESEKRRQWLAAGEMASEVGGRVTHLFRHPELSGEPTPERYRAFDAGPAMIGEVTQWDPPNRLTYSWPGDSGASEVTFELFTEDQDVRLILTHRRLPDRKTRINVASGWHAHLGILIDHLNGRASRGFWSAHAAAEAVYEARMS